jgi:hypothetical protein
MRMVSLTGMAINGTGALWQRQKRYASRKIPSLHETNRRNQWINNTVVPTFNTVKERKNLSATQKAILTVDLWPIHTAKTDTNCFLPWMKATYPWIATIFIPGGCEYLFIRDRLYKKRKHDGIAQGLGSSHTRMMSPDMIGTYTIYHLHLHSKIHKRYDTHYEAESIK